MSNKLRVFEAFAGIGAQRRALDVEAKGKYEVAGSAEWFVPAIVIYQTIHNSFCLENVDKKISRNDMEKYLESKPLSWDSKNLVNKNYWKRKKLSDLRTIYQAVINSEKEGNIFDVNLLYKRKLSDVDLLTYSFPCQDLSQQGIQKGMKKNSGTRSGLLWQIEKALEATPKDKLPRYLLMENVAALMHKQNEKELKQWLNKLELLGYKNAIGILNSGDFGSAQARRRAFMISSIGEKIDLPIGNMQPQSIASILDNEVNNNLFLTNLDQFDLSEPLLTKSNILKSVLKNYSTFNSESYVYYTTNTGPTLTATGANSRIKIMDNGKIRKMSGKEAYKYMGFNACDYQLVDALNLISEAQNIFVCGNSISVEVLKPIMKGFIKNEKREHK